MNILFLLLYETQLARDVAVVPLENDVGHLAIAASSTVIEHVL